MFTCWGLEGGAPQMLSIHGRRDLAPALPFPPLACWPSEVAQGFEGSEFPCELPMLAALWRLKCSAALMGMGLEATGWGLLSTSPKSPLPAGSNRFADVEQGVDDRTIRQFSTWHVYWMPADVTSE